MGKQVCHRATLKPRAVKALATCPTIRAALAGAPGHVWTMAADQAGIILAELFGGICSGLEAVLRNGMVVKRYIYCYSDPVA